MKEPDALPADVHPEVALLPWFANHRLPAREREQVARHLESCVECRRELEDLARFKEALVAAYETQPEPSPQLAQSVLTRVRQEAVRTGSDAAPDRPGLAGLDRWLRSLFLPRWVPTLAVVMLIAQFGLLLWITMPPTLPEQITPRSIESPSARYKVTFQDQATEGQIRALLNAVQGRVIDGPDSDGAYVVEVAAGKPAIGTKTLETLRARTDVVSRAQTVTP